MSIAAERQGLDPRVAGVLRRWVSEEPLLSAVASTHEWSMVDSDWSTRSGRGRVEVGSGFVEAADDATLEESLRLEVSRILLGHPYRRRLPDAELAFIASQITLAEHLATALPLPHAAETFDDAAMSGQSFEFYYRQLQTRRQGTDPPPENADSEDADSNHGDTSGEAADGNDAGQDSPAMPSPAEQSADTMRSDAPEEDAGDAIEDSAANSPGTLGLATPSDAEDAAERADLWDQDDSMMRRIEDAVQRAERLQQYGSVGPLVRHWIESSGSQTLAARRVLQRFRHRACRRDVRRTRMRPSRRYGWHQMGKRRQDNHRIVVAMDVSASMSDGDLQRGLSLIRTVFRFEVDRIDLITFDTDIREGPIALLRAPRRLSITGRGGTDFAPLVRWMDDHPAYDGLLVYTDGLAPPPPPPADRQLPMAFVFPDRDRHDAMAEQLRGLGEVTYLRG